MRARLHDRPRRHDSAAATDSGCRNGPSAVWPTSVRFRFEPARPRVTRRTRSEPREQKSGGEGASPWGLPTLLIVSSVPSFGSVNHQNTRLKFTAPEQSRATDFRIDTMDPAYCPDSRGLDRGRMSVPV